MTANHTILIVDDESIARDILEGHLITEGYNIILASNGFQALRRLERHNPDLVLLDIMMPRMDGFEVCQQIKSNERWQHIPVVLFSGYWDKEQQQRAQEVGADGFLRKPLDGNEVRILVRSLLRIK